MPFREPIRNRLGITQMTTFYNIFLRIFEFRMILVALESEGIEFLPSNLDFL